MAAAGDPYDELSDQFAKKASIGSRGVVVEWAYHVTDVEATKPKPTWTQLECSSANSKKWDKFLLGKQCVFFSTTLYNGGLPTISPYPTSGKAGTSYHRVKVPIRNFSGYIIREDSDKGNQRHLILLTREEDAKLYGSTTEEKPKVLQVRNEYLYEDTEKKWHSNDYSEQKYFVNFAVLHDVDIREGEWDPVKRMKY